MWGVRSGLPTQNSWTSTLLIDAFGLNVSSTYLSKLAVGGMVAFHVSNRSLTLDRVLADLARRSNSISLRSVDGEYNPKTGKDPSEWVVMARQSPAFDALSQNNNWRPLEGRTQANAWTDDFSNILSVFRWY